MSYLPSIFDDINYIHNFNYLYNYDVFDFLNSFLYDFLFEKKDITLNISSTIYSSLDISDNQSCSICLYDYNNEDMITKLECLHFFHTECIKEWGIRKPNCPICRSNISII